MFYSTYAIIEKKVAINVKYQLENNEMLFIMGDDINLSGKSVCL